MLKSKIVWLAIGRGSLNKNTQQKQSTVEPLNKGHFGANSFVPCREVYLGGKIISMVPQKCPL